MGETVMRVMRQAVKNRMKVLLVLLVCHLSPLTAAAQEELEYRMELGAGLGMVTYEGDLNGNLFHDVQPMGALQLRYKLNPRMAWGFQVGYGKLKGSEETYRFSHTLVDASGRFEYNFWPYGTGMEYRGARRLTPFIALGVGITYAGGQEEKDVVTANVPLGAGVRYKLGDRLNVGVEWMMHFTLSDRLDGVKDPYGIRSSGAFKNTDCYSVLRMTLTYDIWPKCKTCNNDIDD